MRGPPPTPTVLKLLRGNPGCRRIHAEPEPAPLPEAPEPPVFLTGHAVAEWRRVVGELHVLGVLRGIDVMLLAAYCQSFSVWRTAVETLATMAAKDAISHGLLVSTKDGARRNPLQKIASDAAIDMLRFANEFGIGPSARSRIAAGWSPPERPSKFGNLLA
jgi:P27 family predicted phage terminase small subunit